MSDKIVVGTDGSETAKQAVAEAMRLAKALDAEVHVVTAFTPRRAKIVGAPEGAAQFWGPLMNDVARSTIDEAAASVRAGGVKVESHMVQQKHPADALLEVARDVGATLIVVGNQGMAGARRVLGSVPNKVSHEARCNVLIVATQRGGAGHDDA